MGASNDSRVYATTDKEKVKKEWEAAVSQSQHENGHSYSGCIGMLGQNIARWVELGKSVNDAEEYICDNHDKWDPGIAVSFKEGDKEGWVVGGWCSS